jgi:hypothetical protein
VHTLFGTIRPIKATHSHPDGTNEGFLKTWPAFPLYSDFSPAPYIMLFLHPWTLANLPSIWSTSPTHPKLSAHFPIGLSSTLHMEQQVSLMLITTWWPMWGITAIQSCEDVAVFYNILCFLTLTCLHSILKCESRALAELVSCLTGQRPGFISMQAHEGFVVDKVGWVFL